MTQFASISFTAADGTTLDAYTNGSDVGLPLVKQAPLINLVGMQIISNRARLTASGTAAHYLSSGVPTGAEYDVAADIQWRDNPSSPAEAAGLLLRAASGSDDSSYIVYYSPSVLSSAGGWQFARFAADGTLTNIANQAAAWNPTFFSTNYTILAQIRNTGPAGVPQVFLWINGIFLATFTETAATITATGSAGLHLRMNTGTPGDNTGAQFDSFSATDGAGLYAGTTGTSGPFTLTATQLPVGTSATVYLHGANTAWNSGTNSPTFTWQNSRQMTVTSARITAQTVTGTGAATLTVDAGSTPGYFTITDPGTGQAVTIQVIAAAVVQDTFANSSGSNVNLESHTGEVGAAWTAQYASNQTAGSAVVTTAGRVRANATGRTHYLAGGVPAIGSYDVYADMAVAAAGMTDTPGLLLQASTGITNASGYVVYYSTSSVAWILGRYDSTGTLTNNLAVVSASVAGGTTYNLRATVRLGADLSVTIALYLGTGGVISSTATLSYTDTSGGALTATGHAGLHWSLTSVPANPDSAVTNFDNVYVYAAPSISLSPSQITAGTTGNTVTVTGTGVDWTAGTPGAPTFGFTDNTTGTGAQKSAQTVTVDNPPAGVALLTIDAGNHTGSGSTGLVITDPSTGAQATLSVVPVLTSMTVTNANWFFSPHNWYSDGGGAMAANNVHGSSNYAQAVNMGAYMKTIFSGTTARLLVAGAVSGAMTIAWTIDNGPLVTHDLMTGDNSAGISLTPTPLAASSHSLFLYVYSIVGNVDRWTNPTQVLKITGLQLDTGASLAAPTLAAGKLLVFGDSLAEGINAVSASATASLADNAYYGFPFPVGQALSAEVGVVGWGSTGWCVANNANVPAFDTPGDDVHTSWNKYSAGKSRLVAGKISPIPDMVVVAHGRNDARIGVSDATVEASITDWLAAMRAAVNTTTPIILSVPFSGAKRTAITAAFAAYQNTHADPALYLVDLGTAVQPGINGNLTDEATLVFTPTGATEASPDGSHLYAHTAGRLGAALAHAIQQATGLTSIGTGSKALKRGR